MAHPLSYYVVDAFTLTACQGNPAAVVVLPMPVNGRVCLDDDVMQRIAMEINLSETAFAWPNPDDGRYTIRYFTPTKEIELCGHATMATAAILFDGESSLLETSSSDIQFDTLYGESLHCTYCNGEIAMRFPSDTNVRKIRDCGLTQAFRGEHTIEAVYEGRYDIMVVMTHACDVQKLQVDMNVLEAVTQMKGKRGVIVTSASDNGDGVDFVSRFFAPAAGIPEDPVTGSAHCTLGPYWKSVLNKSPDTRLVGRQVGPKRQGTVRVRCVDEKTVEISGHAVIVSKTIFYPSIFD
jgi:PhzF family phenazine biosynthesis protein